MKPQLILSLAPDSIDRIEADVAVVALFRDERPLRGSASRIDWRMCGRLSQLLRDERFAGNPGEAALFPGQGGLRAPMLIALGLGARASFDGARCRAAAREAVERGLKLRARALVLALLEAGAETMDLGARMEAILAGALGAPALGPTSGAGSLTLHLVAAPEERPAALEWLRAAAQRGLPAGAEVALPGATRSRADSTPGGQGDFATPDGRWSSNRPARRF